MLLKFEIFRMRIGQVIKLQNDTDFSETSSVCVYIYIYIYIHKHIYEGGLKSSYEDTISAVDDFFINRIQALQH